MIPFSSIGQIIKEPVSEIPKINITSWLESTITPGNHKRISDQIVLADHNSTLPTDVVFTLSSCNEFSICLKNGGGLITFDQTIYEFYDQNGILAYEYTEPDFGEANYGNTSTYTSGITPDFQITTPGVYNLKIRCFNGTNEEFYSFYGIQVLSNLPTFTLNAPDTVCYNSNVCWTVTPTAYTSLVGNWGVNPQFPTIDPTNPFNPCKTPNTLGSNTISVNIIDMCDGVSTLSKNLYVKYMSDFDLPTSVCPNQIVNVGNIYYCHYPNNPTSFLWNWGDGSTSNTQYASHSYTNPGSYIVSLTVGTVLNGQYQTSTMNKNIIVNHPPTSPIVTGSFTTCNNPGAFIITNPDANTTYNWTSPYSSSITGSNTNKNITWDLNIFPTLPSDDGNINPIPGSFSIISNSNGCIDTTDYKVWKCCRGQNSERTYNDTTITSNFPTGNVYLNGTITVNGNLNQSNTNFLMGPEAKIIVTPPYTFELNNQSMITDGCRYMWDGIYVESPQSKVKLDNIAVNGAINAINSKNGGNFEIINTKFGNNYISIKVTDYRPLNLINHPGIVNGCSFDGLHILDHPYLGQKTYTGIYTDNVYNLTIGNSSSVNTFDNVFCGIQSYNSYLTVVKNTFQNIQKTPLCTPGEVTDYSQLYCETAIHVAKKPSTLIDPLYPTVTIGGDNTTAGNTFTNCDIAYNSYITGQTIKNNVVKTCKTGFMFRDPRSPNVISNNTIKYTYSGINVNSTTPSPRGITIENNTLDTVGTYGIRVFNCKSIGLVRTNILNNSINYKAAIANGKGIYVANSDAINITGNNITSSALTSSGLRKFFRGVNVENSPNAVIKANTINKLGTGIYAEGMLVGAQLQCNTMFQNYYGVYMPNGLAVATVYSDQGTSSMPNDNKWTADHPSPTSGIPTYRITGDAGTTIQQKYWYYRGGITSYFPNVVSPNPAYYFAYPIATISNAPSPCGSKGGDDENIANTDSTSTMETIIPDNANLAVQMRYLYMSMLFNSNAEEFGTEMTEDEQSLYQNIPLIAKINDLSQNDTTIDRAIALNNTLAPINEMETYRKFVNDIYLNYVAKAVQPSAELIDELYSIADMAPNIGGEAVYIARAILNYEPTKLVKQDIILPIKITANNQIQFYPNPANDVLNISSTESFVSGSKIELFDITGRMIYTVSISSESNTTSISLKEVKQGLYFCVIKNGEEIISSSKISIVKQ